jgi:hypothetical protein
MTFLFILQCVGFQNGIFACFCMIILYKKKLFTTLAARAVFVQWGSEFWTSLVFKCFILDSLCIWLQDHWINRQNDLNYYSFPKVSMPFDCLFGNLSERLYTIHKHRIQFFGPFLPSFNYRTIGTRTKKVWWSIFRYLDILLSHHCISICFPNSHFWLNWHYFFSALLGNLKWKYLTVLIDPFST